MRNDSLLPPVVLEAIRRPQGLLILAGTRSAGLESTLDGIREQCAGRRFHRWSEGTQVPADAEVVEFSGEPGAPATARLLSLSEEGCLVLWVHFCPSPVSALRRIFSISLGEGRRHVLARLSEQLVLLMGQMRVKTIGGDGFEEAREILLVTPPLRAAIALEDISVVEELLHAGEETSGMVSFNQSLLQLLLRRRIDIKTAFEVTRDPVELDQLLKKVGI